MCEKMMIRHVFVRNILYNMHVFCFFSKEYKPILYLLLLSPSQTKNTSEASSGSSSATAFGRSSALCGSKIPGT